MSENSTFEINLFPNAIPSQVIQNGDIVVQNPEPIDKQEK